MTAYSEVEFLDVDESCLFHSLPLSAILDDCEACSDLFRTFNEELAPVSHSRIGFDCIIITADSRCSFVTLYPSPRLAYSKGLGKEGVPVPDTTHQPSSMYVVGKARLERPFASAVLNYTVKRQLLSHWC